MQSNLYVEHVTYVVMSEAQYSNDIFNYLKNFNSFKFLVREFTNFRQVFWWYI